MKNTGDKGGVVLFIVAAAAMELSIFVYIRAHTRAIAPREHYEIIVLEKSSYY